MVSLDPSVAEAVTLVTSTIEEGLNEPSMKGAEMAAEEVVSLGASHKIMSNEDIQWNETKNIWIHTASGMIFMPHNQTDFTCNNEKAKDLRAIYYTPLLGSLKIARHGRHRKLTTYMLKGNDRDKRYIYSSKSPGFHPLLLEIFKAKRRSFQ